MMYILTTLNHLTIPLMNIENLDLLAIYSIRPRSILWRSQNGYPKVS